MRVLLVKTSSLGDVVHALPAVTEAVMNQPDLSFDWVVEEAFAAIPELHPAVNKVLPIALRRWRKNLLGSRAEIARFRTELQSQKYDLVLDSQGLVKSALVSFLAHGRVAGFDQDSARESLASISYEDRYPVPQDMHAVLRQKQLFGEVFSYRSEPAIDYGIARSDAVDLSADQPAIALLHGTTWESKEWPETLWRSLADLIRAADYRLIVPAGNPGEFERAKRITGNRMDEILDRQAFPTVIAALRSLSGVVSVDTGLGHLATAFDIPVVGLYGSTSPALTGFRGVGTEVIVSDHLPCIPCRKRHCQYEMSEDSSKIHPPCYAQHSPESVWQALQLQIQHRRNQRQPMENP